MVSKLMCGGDIYITFVSFFNFSTGLYIVYNNNKYVVIKLCVIYILPSSSDDDDVMTSGIIFRFLVTIS